ncbi:NAD(P)-dependent oxidoreductase [Nafulsella turpanensis]|uniref:NAD(P)-dependent oxidoreductase n=1 Tax=Nafulsella turpanensis TaxID=1265690 RepID=UPI00034CC195|nr:NAD(P)-dependent oxidoreductase [Nafulsella turpanensis]
MIILNRKVLIIDKMHDSIFNMLEQIGFSADYRPDASRQEIEAVVGDYEVLFLRSKLSVDEAFLRKAGRLKVVGRAGAGVDQLDVETLEQRGISLINAPEGNRDAVAEHAVGMLLCLQNNLLKADAQVRQSIWDREGNRGTELSEKTVGIIGYGHMGQAFARRLQGFGCRLLAYDKFRQGFSDELVQESSQEDIFEQADVVSFHFPLTEENRGIINGAYLSRFKKEILLINTARGEILPLKDLVEKLKSGKVRGAALDVLENEKLHQLSAEEKENFDYLVQCDKVLLSPHVAGWTHESYRKINAVLVEKLKNLLY